MVSKNNTMVHSDNETSVDCVTKIILAHIGGKILAV